MLHDQTVYKCLILIIVETYAWRLLVSAYRRVRPSGSFYCQQKFKLIFPRFQLCFDNAMEIADPKTYERVPVARDDRAHASLLILNELLRISISEADDSDNANSSYSQASNTSDKVVKIHVIFIF